MSIIQPSDDKRFKVEKKKLTDLCKDEIRIIFEYLDIHSQLNFCLTEKANIYEACLDDETGSSDIGILMEIVNLYGKLKDKGNIRKIKSVIPDLRNWVQKERKGRIFVGREWNLQTGNIEGKGKGIYKSRNGKTKIYEGNFTNGKREGKGTMYYQDGKNSKKKKIKTVESKYEGNWKDGKREGKGKMYFPNGSIYYGDWKNGKREGIGRMKFRNGKELFGKWKNGEFLDTKE